MHILFFEKIPINIKTGMLSKITFTQRFQRCDNHELANNYQFVFSTEVL